MRHAQHWVFERWCATPQTPGVRGGILLNPQAWREKYLKIPVLDRVTMTSLLGSLRSDAIVWVNIAQCKHEK